MTLMKSDFPKICRICLLFKTDMFSVYNPDITTAVKDCLDIEINEDDELPKSICSDCSDQLSKFADFRELYKNSEKILHQIVTEDFIKNNDNYDEDDYTEHDMLIDNTHVKDEANIKEESELDFKEEKIDALADPNNDIRHNELDEIEVKLKNCTNNEQDIETMMNHVDRMSKRIVHCKICGKKMQESALFGHLRRHQQGKKHKCEKCSKAYREPCELAKHLQRVHHSKGNIECDVCRKTFLIQAQLDFHLKRHFKKKYPCDICGKECYKSAKLKRHKETHEKREKSFFCLKCDSAFLHEVSLKLHVKRYHSETPHKKQACPLCNKVVYDVRLHTLHIHSNVRPHKCDKCEKAFTFKSVLMKHVREKHLGIQQEFKALCPTCGKACPSQGELKKHLRTHVEERRFDCHLCDKKYKSGDGLRNHLKVHAGLRPYVCTYCTKAFHTNAILKNHLRTHTGERPFACHICGRAFTQKVSLRTHMKVHCI